MKHRLALVSLMLVNFFENQTPVWLVLPRGKSIEPSTDLNIETELLVRVPHLKRIPEDVVHIPDVVMQGERHARDWLNGGEGQGQYAGSMVWGHHIDKGTVCGVYSHTLAITVL